MRHSQTFCTVACALLILSPVRAAFAAVDLDTVFNRAIGLSESVTASKELSVQADELSYQASASLLPRINGIASYQRQQVPSETIGSRVSPPEQKVLRLNAVQPLFRGFGEYAGIRQRKESKLAAESNLKESRRQLYLDVTTRFYNVLQFERSLELLKQEIEVHERRIREQKEFEKVGRVKRSDVLQTESLQAARKADYSNTSISLERERIQLLRLSGIPRDEKLKDTFVLPAKIQPLKSYLATSSARPDVTSLEHQYRAADEGVGVTRGTLLPSIDLTGNYWFVRPGAVQDVHWDVAVSATIPIFNGGVLRSQLRQAQSLRHQLEMNHIQAKEVASAEVEGFYESIRIGLERIANLETAQKLSAKSAELFQKDYKLGLTSNLEVLQAISQAQESQRLLDLAKLTLKADYIRLEVASGKKFGDKAE